MSYNYSFEICNRLPSMPEVTKAIKLEMEGEESAFYSLDGQSKICNWSYNHLLEYANSKKKQAIETNNFEQAKVIYTERGLRNLIPTLKEEFAFLKSVYSSPLKNTALRLSSAIQDHQKGKKGKRKNKTGWPGFRSWGKKWFSLLYDEPYKGYKIEHDSLTLSLGVDEYKKRLSLKFKLKDVSRLKGYEIRNLRINKENGKYYAVFTVQAIVPEKKSIQRIIALDPNHKNLAYGVDNEHNAIEIERAYWLKLHDKQLMNSKAEEIVVREKQKNVLFLIRVVKQQGKNIIYHQENGKSVANNMSVSFIEVKTRKKRICIQ